MKQLKLLLFVSITIPYVGCKLQAPMNPEQSSTPPAAPASPAVPAEPAAPASQAASAAPAAQSATIPAPSKPVKEAIETPQPALLAQPKTVPGNWNLDVPQPLPPLQQALQRRVPGRLVYGLYTWAGEYHKYRNAIRKVGWKSIRIAGPFDDRLMQALAEDDVNTMVTLSNRMLDPAKGKSRADYPSDEAFINDTIRHVDAFLKRYGPGGAFFREHPETPKHPIRAVELWNEPNFQYMIPPDGRPRQEIEKAREALYAKLLARVYPAIKPKYPEVTLVGFGAGGMSAGDLRFIEHVHQLKASVVKDYDVLSTHPYVRPAPPEANSVQSWGSYSIARGLEYIRNVLKKRGVRNKPIWYTEIGWPISHQDGGAYGTPPGKVFVTPLLQAAYICRTYLFALRLDVERVHIMFVSDTDHFNGGVFLRDGSWRPAAHAVQTLLRTLPDPALTGAISDGADGYYAYTFLRDAQQDETPENQAWVLWNVGGPRTVTFEAQAPAVMVTDMLGTSRRVATNMGRLTIEIGPCPIYITPVH